MKHRATEYFENAATAQLAEAAAGGDQAGVARAIQNRGDVNAVGRTGITPLLYVLSETRDKRGIRALLAAGANPNYMKENGFGPLLLAAQGNDLDLLRIFLDAGGDPNLRNPDGEPAALLAIRQRRWENLKLLLDRGADINARDRSSYTLLMKLAILGQFEEAATLIQRGADLNAVANNGHTFAKITAERSNIIGEQRVWREKVIAMLAERGVTLPQLKH